MLFFAENVYQQCRVFNHVTGDSMTFFYWTDFHIYDAYIEMENMANKAVYNYMHTYFMLMLSA